MKKRARRVNGYTTCADCLKRRRLFTYWAGGVIKICGKCLDIRIGGLKRAGLL